MIQMFNFCPNVFETCKKSSNISEDRVVNNDFYKYMHI